MIAKLIIALLFLSASALAATPLTLKEALSKATSSNPELKMSEFEFDARKGLLKSEKSL